MTISIETLWTMPVPELLAAYYDARRGYVERKFTRDSQRARLEWLKGTSKNTPGQTGANQIRFYRGKI
jgi:hypothetical protein